MSLTTGQIALVLACSFGWVGLDFLRKAVTPHGRTVPLAFLVVAVQVPILVVWAVADGRFAVAPAYVVPALVSVVMNVIANLSYMHSVKLSPMSATVPLLSLTPVLTTLLGIPLLGERPGVVEWSGVLIVVLGALLLNSAGGVGQLVSSLAHERGAPFMVLVALCWSLALPFDKRALAHAAAPIHALVLSLGVSLAILVVLWRQGRVGELASFTAWKLLGLVAAVSVAALVFQLWAIQEVWVGLVETVKRGIGASMALVLGAAIFRERLSGRKIFAVGLMVVGVAMVLGVRP